MNYMAVYNECIAMFKADIQEMVQELDVSVDKAFAMVTKRDEQLKRHTEELAAVRQQIEDEKASIIAAVVPFLQQSQANGVMPDARGTLDNFGYPHSRRNIGVVNWQIKRLSHHSSTANVMPAE